MAGSSPSAPGRPENLRTDPLFLCVMATRVVGLVAVAYFGWRVWHRGYTNTAYMNDQWPGGFVLGFLSFPDLVFHEAGHWIFAPFGEFMTALGGSLNQVLIPAICAGAFFWQQKYASAAVTLFWTGESTTQVALYAADGRDRFLPLLGDLGPENHDWGRILTWMGVVNRAELVGGLIFAAGIILVLAAIMILGLEVRRAWKDPRGALKSFQQLGPE